jgi:hypothetical protein
MPGVHAKAWKDGKAERRYGSRFFHAGKGGKDGKDGKGGKDGKRL